MKSIDQEKTRVGVVYTCSLNCGEGGGKDFMMPINKEVEEELKEKCPSCEKGNLILDIEKSWSAYQTELKEKSYN